MASNNQTVTLAGVTLADLSAANFTIKSSDTGQEILALVGSGGAVTPPETLDDPVEPDEPDTPDLPETPEEPVEPDAPDTPDLPVMTMITPTSPSRTITDFDPTQDMIHLETGVIAERLQISDDGSDLTVTVYTSVGSIASETVFTGVTVSDLSMSNFMVAEQSALNEVATLLGQSLEVPETGGFDVVYEANGSNPPVPLGSSDLGGVRWSAEYGMDDIIGFNPATDQIDFGGASVHGLILTMTPNGEPMIHNPWGTDMQILQGVQLSELSIENFGIVVNEHLRQDLGGILSWEKGIGPRDADTVYIRSHEYGQSEVINGFDPETQKINFLYFGTRELLSVEDTDDGLLISSLPSGQSFLFTGVAKADLVPGNLEFHFDQVMEDNLEAAFEMDQLDVSLVSREALLTPAAPAGETTDGFQVRDGVGTTGDGGELETPETPETPDMPETPETPETPGDVTPPATSDTIVLQQGSDTVGITWDWGRTFAVQNFDPAEDILNFGGLSASDVLIEEIGSDLMITVLNNGGHGYLFENLQAEDLSIANLTASGWNPVVTDAGGITAQLQALGNNDLLA